MNENARPAGVLFHNAAAVATVGERACGGTTLKGALGIRVMEMKAFQGIQSLGE